MNKTSVYIHIPFCKSICAYCDFCKVLYNKEWVITYLKKLKDEIKERYMGESIKTIYIGGGTPSSLSLKEIEYLLTLTKIFDTRELEEFTFECNIEDISEELLQLLAKFNVTRLSLGIESFNEENLLLMKRTVDYKDVVSKMNLIRSNGFNNVNVDLIYALPGEKMKVLKKDIKLLLSLNPEHISTYSLMIEDNTFLSYKKVNNIPEELDALMYEYICKKLKKAGYFHYEISNFSKTGYESKHNLTYWNNEEYYGFGCGASGYIAGVRYDNTRSLSKYLKGEINSTDNLLSQESIMEYEMILGLRKTKGIKLQDFYDKYKVNMQDVFPIKPLIKNGDLIYEDGYVKINPKKLYIMNEILLKLV
ncbi:MAG: radical SAM family heme chaperone HemW [Firmicutes bacterium]|nr:radical SAM family heme chaperone HemW [Bacillota bacterium]